jgi:hypothetical protein
MLACDERKEETIMGMRTAMTALVAIFAGTATGGEISSATDGKSDYTIVEAAAPTAAEAFAVKELAKFLGQSALSAPRVVKEADFQGDAPAVFVGQTGFAGKSGIDFKNVGPEEWVVRSVGKNLVIAGGRPRGTLYGVYEFLERIVGVRFLDAHTVFVPERPAWKVPGDLAIQAQPAFFRREIFMVTLHHPEHNLFQVRRRLNSFGNAAVDAAGPELGFCVIFGSPYSTHTHHLYAKQFPTGQPEHYALTEKGTRTGPGPDGQMCLSHPEVRKLFAAQLREYVRQDRERITSPARLAPAPSPSTG